MSRAISPVAAFLLATLGLPWQANAAAVVVPSLTIDSTSATGSSFTYSGTLTGSDTLSLIASGAPCLQSGAYCTNAAGVVVVAGTQPVGGFSINPLDGNTYGSLLLSISGVAGSEQLFPTTAANGLGSSSPPTSLFLSSTPLSDFFGSFSEVNPTLTFVMSDSLFTDNSGSFSVASPVPEPSAWAMMILGFAGIGFLTYRRQKGAPLAT
jgi:PEP-CTERM motif-containing protein